MPAQRNPETGWIATANSKIAGPEYPHYLGLDVAADHRTRRIVSHLQDLRSEEHTSELQSQSNLVCRLLLEKKKQEGTRPCTPRSLSSRTLGGDGESRPICDEKLHPSACSSQTSSCIQVILSLCVPTCCAVC